jgi:predicted nucleic acid-binding protein
VILPDFDVLLYAFRTDSVEHERYRDWLADLVNGDEAYGMSPQVLCSVARIAPFPDLRLPQPTRRRTGLLPRAPGAAQLHRRPAGSPALPDLRGSLP